MKKLILLVAAVFAVAGTQYALQLAPEAVITIQAWSPQELADAGMDPYAASGLRVVGVESLVYFEGSEASGEDVLTYEWSATSHLGVVDPTDAPHARTTSFRPSDTGRWTITLTITTASGTATTSTSIVAAKYVGVGNIAGAPPDAGEGQCAACHPHNTADWAETPHAHLFREGIDGIASDHYSANCISCHVLGYDLSADNNGFDDVADLAGWTFPAETVAGNWDNLVANYPALAQRGAIQCENCHGPGSEHKGVAANTDISVMTGVCAVCHDRGSHHNKPSLWKRSGHYLGSSFASRGPRSGCADCHSTYGFIARMDPFSDLDQKVGTGEGIECAACHDPHADDEPSQLRPIKDIELVDGTVVTWGGVGRLCMNCHKARRAGATQIYASGHIDPHHSNQGDMLAANNVAITFGRYIPSSTHRNALEDACVSCHMYETPGTPEAGRYFVGEHTFAVAADMDGMHVENVEACVRCHGEIESFEDIMAREDYDGDGDVESTEAEVEGLMEELAMLLPPFGSEEIDEDAEGGLGEWPLLWKKALFNYNFVYDDGSHGFHNFQYTVGLLKVTIDAMHYGILTAGSITEINDVPNDQGKKVQIVWERFGGDGTSDDPVAVYAVLRLDGAVAGKAPLPKLEDVDLETTSVGTRVVMNGEAWTQVGMAEAFQMDSYSLEVPTLFDDTETTFKVVAKTRSSQYVVMSEAAVGMSSDNLIPTAPMGLAAEATSFDVTLTWQELDLQHNPDVDYYAVYRGDATGFMPGEPIATVTDPMFFDDTVVPGNWYYYQVAAFDFSGNQGEFSGEVAAAVSVDAETLGLPTDYALHQNYPNPFNPSTTITFDVPAASEIVIVVYDLLGRQVKTLVNGSIAAGRHEVTFDATGLTSGLYIVRMRSGDRVFERSVVLMK